MTLKRHTFSFILCIVLMRDSSTVVLTLRSDMGRTGIKYAFIWGVGEYKNGIKLSTFPKNVQTISAETASLQRIIR